MFSTDMDDWSLLQDYVERRSELAFEALVRRHLNMVYSAAWRQTGDVDLAEETAQAVFVLLARKGARLPRGVIIAGWLHRAACLTARRALRDQTHRRIKQREAVEMKPTDDTDEIWNRLLPHLDAALENLGEADRTAIVLRFLEQRNFRDVAAALSVSEDAAKKRVMRALEKLRLVFARKGVTLGLATAAVVLSAKATEAAPAGLLKASVQAGLSGGMAAAPAVGALAAGVAREALISRLQWSAALAVLGLLLAVMGPFHWLKPKPNGPTKTGASAEHTVAMADAPSQPPLQLPVVSAEPADTRALLLRVVAEENDRPLAGIAVHVEFIVLPNSVLAAFPTDPAGAARIMLPANPLHAMSCWVSVPGRVPMTISWNRTSMESLPPEYTLRLPPGRFVAGTVTDETGHPVGGAAVHFQAEGMPWDSREYADYEGPPSLGGSDRLPPVVTDATGCWSADFISPRAKRLFGYLEHPEFAITQFGHICPPAPVPPSTNLLLVLEKGTQLTGFVRDPAAQPIREAQVTLQDELGRPPRSEKTDAAGRFEFRRVADDPFRLSVQAKGFQSSGDLLLQSTQRTDLDIVLKAVQVAGHSVIRGKVVSTEGQPIARAEVHLAPGQPGLGEIDWGMLTDSEGRFKWSAAPDHPVELAIGGSISAWEEQRVEFAPDGTEPVIALKAKAKILLHGTASDKSTGSPLPEFKVLWAPGSKEGYVVNTSILTEGRDGRFSVGLLPEQVGFYPPPGSISRLDFQAPGYVNKVVSLVPGTNDIELAVELEPAVDVAGIALLPDGNPATGAKAFFRGEHFRFQVGEDCFVSRGEYPFAVEARAGVNGAFHIPKIDGIERLELVHPEGWANVPPDALSTAVVRLQPWGRINGLVQFDQRGLPGVEVRAIQARNQPEQMLFEFTVKTDADGRFEFSKLPAGRAFVFVPPLADGSGTNRAAQEVLLEPGQTTRVNLTISAHP